MSDDAIKKLLMAWLLSKPMMGAFNLSSSGSHWEFYDMALINEPACKARSKKSNHPIKRDEVLKSYQDIDLYANQEDWKKNGFEIEALTQINHGKEIFYFIYNKLDDEGKTELLSLGERFLLFPRMLNIWRNDKEVFTRYMQALPKSFTGLLKTDHIVQVLQLLREHHKDDAYTDLLYSFLSSRKKQLGRIEAQSLANHAVNLYAKDKSRFEEFFHDIVGEDYFLPPSSVVCLKVSKILFYNLINAGAKPFDKSLLTNYLLSFINYIDKKEKKRLFLNHAYLLNHDNGAKHYIIVLDATQVDIAYQDMIETVLKMCRDNIGIFENKQEHFKKALDYYFLEKALPSKGTTLDKVSKI